MFTVKYSQNVQRSKAQASDTNLEEKKAQGKDANYVKSEVLVKFKQDLRVKSEQKGKGIDFETGDVAFDDLDQATIPQKIKDLHDQNKIQKVEKVFKGTKNEHDDLTRIYKLTLLDDISVSGIISQLSDEEGIDYTQPNYLVTAFAAPNDPFYSSSNSWGQGYADLWGLKKVETDASWWNSSAAGQGVIVAVVDTGVNYNHADISSNIWTNTKEIAANGIDDDGNGYRDDTRGWDFTTNNNNPMDQNGHGTHVSGTIAAIANNSRGIVGVAPRAKIMPLRGLDASGFGTIDNLAKGIVYAAANGAKVINNSWGCQGGCPTNPVSEDAVRAAYNFGATVVFAAGNDSADVYSYSPQNMTNPKPVVVSATDQNDTATSFSNKGLLVDIAAPGGGTATPTSIYKPASNILSLKATSCTICDSQLVVGNQYIRFAGTSMASPHAAGLAALILSAHPTYTPEEVRQVMRISATDLGAVGPDQATGWGRINAVSALSQSALSSAVITSPTGNQKLSGSSINILGTAAGNGFASYKVEYGAGLYPSTWITITNSTTAVTNTTLATWNLGSVSDGLYAIRLTVQNTSGKKVSFEMYVTRVKDLRSGFPVLLERTERAPAIADVNNDGKPEIVVVSQSGFNPTGYVHILNTSGKDLTGWPKSIETYGFSAAGVGDIDGDGSREIVITGENDSGAGKIYAFRASGNSVSGFPKQFTNRFVASPVLFDLNGDGKLEIIVGDVKGMLYAVDGKGSILKSINLAYGDNGAINAEITSSVAVGKDTVGIIIVAKVFQRDKSLDHLWFLDQNLAVLPKGYRSITGSGGYAGPVLVDLNNDGQFEIVTSGSVYGVYAHKRDGSLVSGWPVTPSGPANSQPDVGSVTGQYLAVGDINGDGKLEVFAAGNGSAKGIYAWYSNGAPIPGWPAGTSLSARFDGPITVGNIDSDSAPEVLSGGSNAYVYAFKANGSLVPGWPKYTATNMYTTSAVQLSDIDINGKVDVVAGMTDGFFNGGIAIWSLTDRFYPLPWHVFQHDEKNTGTVPLPTTTPTPASVNIPVSVSITTPSSTYDYQVKFYKTSVGTRVSCFSGHADSATKSGTCSNADRGVSYTLELYRITFSGSLQTTTLIQSKQITTPTSGSISTVSLTMPAYP